MNVRCVAQSIEVLEDSQMVVLRHETVETWIRDHGVGHVAKEHKGMAMPYESTGRTGQRSTREVLLAAAHQLMDPGGTATVEQVADSAEISRTTTYRYLRNNLR
jgi:hypothetical protein